MIVSLFNNYIVVIALVCMEKMQRMLHIGEALTENITVNAVINYGCKKLTGYGD